MNSRVGNCTRFLHQGKELAGPESNQVTQDNRETHRALLFPITLVFKPTEILFICDGKGRVAKTIFSTKGYLEIVKTTTQPQLNLT